MASRTAFTSGPLAEVAGGVGEHRHARVDPERPRGLRRADRDVGELLHVRLGVDRAVAVDQHAVGHAHKEDARDHPRAGRALITSNAGRIVSPVVCAAPGHHPVGLALAHHHRAEVAHVGHRLERQLLGHAAVLAQLVVDARRSARAAASSRGSTSRARSRSRPSVWARALHLVGPAEDREVHGRRGAAGCRPRAARGRPQPSGSTMWRRSSLARSISSYSNMTGVIRGGRSSATRSSSSTGSTAAPKAPSARGDLALVVGPEPGPDLAHRRRGGEGGRIRLEHRERRALEHAPHRRGRLVAPGQEQAQPAPAARARARTTRLATRMSARSPGTITSVPCSRASEEVLDAHRGDLHGRHRALERRAGAADARVERGRHLGHVRPAQLAAPRPARTRAARPPRRRERSFTSLRMLRRNPADDHSEQLAAAPFERLARGAHRLRGAVRCAAANHHEHRSSRGRSRAGRRGRSRAPAWRGRGRSPRRPPCRRRAPARGRRRPPPSRSPPARPPRCGPRPAATDSARIRSGVTPGV